jgi:hypothetical protein
MERNLHKEHLLNITEVTYASPQNVTLYQQQICNHHLKKVIQKQLIFSPLQLHKYYGKKIIEKILLLQRSIDLAGNIRSGKGVNIKRL